MLGHVDGTRPEAPSDGGTPEPVLLDGRYRLDGVLGRGALGVVHRAHDVLLERDVAVKVLPGVDDDTDAYLRNQAEIRVLAGLHHPGLVTLYDAGTVDDAHGGRQVYLVMELVDGPTLAERLRHGRLSTEQTARVGRDIALALAAVHEREIIHRDIKPANILLTGPDSLDGTDGTAGPTVKVADFGIARLADGTRLTMTGVTLGTVRYLSPEQATGVGLGPASDIYTLGLVLIECATGRPAFSGTTAEAALARLAGPPDVPADLDPDLVGLLTRMTQMSPDDRPAAREVAAELAALADADGTRVLPVTPGPTGTGPGVKGSTRRLGPSRAALVAGALALLTTGVLLVGQHLREPQSPPAQPVYPTVPGTLGDSLVRLQTSVQP
ncbi:serine/threonine-protein kinase [Cellulomonas sp. URHE0023]|uniref:serine/threonine-protein kinase n=1 Tax=Cellulomonas sp. URHE0023 TaxID=1380354 RepID=UPI000481FA91|nr:serine/threonine-protein kinase [Cellulomonas sp. URHE0023]